MLYYYIGYYPLEGIIGVLIQTGTELVGNQSKKNNHP